MKDYSISLISAILVLIGLIYVSEVVIDDTDCTVKLHVESNSYYDELYEEEYIYAEDL